MGSELLGTVEFLGQLILKKWLVPQNIRSPFRNTVALDTSFPLMQVLAPIKSKMHVNNVFSAYHNGMKSFLKYYTPPISSIMQIVISSNSVSSNSTPFMTHKQKKSH